MNSNTPGSSFSAMRRRLRDRIPANVGGSVGGKFQIDRVRCRPIGARVVRVVAEAQHLAVPFERVRHRVAFRPRVLAVTVIEGDLVTIGGVGPRNDGSPVPSIST